MQYYDILRHVGKDFLFSTLTFLSPVITHSAHVTEMVHHMAFEILNEIRHSL